jgi:hypothetical protein
MTAFVANLPIEAQTAAAKRIAFSFGSAIRTYLWFLLFVAIGALIYGACATIGYALDGNSAGGGLYAGMVLGGILSGLYCGALTIYLSVWVFDKAVRRAHLISEQHRNATNG